MSHLSPALILTSEYDLLRNDGEGEAEY
ncbi:alpha/beta hydrolase [Deinococcus sp. QL22]|nr:alpha/beta hydrolase [Deinococcus sp. QL22]UQN08539.1 alpha/beta hydrolase [Deinococcus sp. QL22]